MVTSINKVGFAGIKNSLTKIVALEDDVIKKESWDTLFFVNYREALR